MATNRIKGITVEIGGDVSGLSKSLTGVNKEIKSTQSQLKDVERLLKLDPTNTNLLQQRQRLLAQAVEETKTKLDALKDAEKQVQQQVAEGKASQEQYEGLQREIVATEQELKSLEDEAQKFGSVFSQQIQLAGSKVQDFGEKISGVGEKLLPVTGVVAGLGAVAFNSASDLVESQNKVEVAFGESAQSVIDFADTTLDAYGIAKGTAMDMAAQFGDMATSMSLSSEQASEMSMSLVGLAGDLSSFKNIDIETAMRALNGIFTGETESLKTLGVVMTQTNLDAYALANGFGKTTSEMSEAEKVQLRYSYVLSATKNAQGDFARTSDGAANSIRVMQESLKEASAEFGEVLLPIITPVIQKITELIKWVSALDDGQKNTIVTIAMVVAAIGPMLIILGKTISAVGSIMEGIGKIGPAITTISTKVLPALQSAFTSVFSFIAANPIVLLIAAIVALVVLIAAKGDEIQAVLQKVDDFLQGVFATDWTKIFGPVLGGILNSFFANLKNIWDSVKQILNGIIDFIRGVFTGDWQRAWNGIVEMFAGIWNGLVAIAKWPINAIIGFINAAIGGVNSLISGLNKIPGVSIGQIGTIPLLANGGIVKSGSAIVGDAGPELLTVSGGKAVVQPLNVNTGKIEGMLGNISGQLGQYAQSDIPFVVQLMMDSDVIGQAAFKYNRRRERSCGY